MVDRLVVFDLDGTLAETAGDLMGALNHVLSLDGIAPLPVEQARNLLGAGGRALIQRGYATAGRSLDTARLEELFRLFLAYYEQHIADHSFLFPGVVAAQVALILVLPLRVGRSALKLANPLPRTVSRHRAGTRVRRSS